MLKLQLICIYVLLSCLADAQIIRRQPSVFYARPPVDERTEVTAATLNPATLAGMATLQISVFGERRYMIADLNVCRAIVGMPIHGGGIAASLDYFGNGVYREFSFSSAYARKIGKAALGIAFRYQSGGAAGYKTVADFDGDIGLMLTLTPKFETGIQLSDASTVLLNKSGNDYFPSVSSIWRYSLSKKLALNISLSKWKGSDLRFTTSLYYSLTERCVVRTGIGLQPSEIFGAVSFRVDDFIVGIAAGYQSPLGLSPAMIFQYHRPGE